MGPSLESNIAQPQEMGLQIIFFSNVTFLISSSMEKILIDSLFSKNRLETNFRELRRELHFAFFIKFSVRLHFLQLQLHTNYI